MRSSPTIAFVALWCMCTLLVNGDSFYVMQMNTGALTADLYVGKLSTTNPAIQSNTYVANVAVSWYLGQSFITTTDASTGNFFVGGGENLESPWQLFVVNPQLQSKELFRGTFPVFTGLHADNKGGLVIATNGNNNNVSYNTPVQTAFWKVDIAQQTLTSICNVTIPSFQFNTGLTAYDVVGNTIYGLIIMDNAIPKIGQVNLTTCKATTFTINYNQGFLEMNALAFSMNVLYGVNIDGKLVSFSLVDSGNVVVIADPNFPSQGFDPFSLLINDNTQTAYYIGYTPDINPNLVTVNLKTGQFTTTPLENVQNWFGRSVFGLAFAPQE